MPSYLLHDARGPAVPITPIRKDALKGWLEGPGKSARGWVESTHFAGKAGAVCLVPGRNGELERVLLGVGEEDEHWAYAGLPGQLP